MCGISGFCDFNKNSDRNLLVKMTNVLHYRGPDDSGYLFHENNSANIGLGHRRLSILDLSSCGHQPMSFDYLNIVYNGEIYNFKEIKNELVNIGYSFQSESDTEVILKSYHKWGIKAVDKFNGMFAIALYDKKNDKLIFIRDRAGVKPFFYYIKDDLILFSSELKSFHVHPNFKKKIDKNALALYLQTGYIPEPYSIFQNTHKLKAGHYLEINLDNKNTRVKQYWDVCDFYNKPKLDISENEALETTEKLLKSAFEYRMVSDLPVGIFLSGGYDSSIVTAMLQHQRKDKIQTFTIGFNEEKYNEAPYAKNVAKYLGTNHTEYYCTQKEAINIIPKLCEIYDEPFGDNSAIPTTLISAVAKEKVTVCLSADAGDEIFAGYSRYATAMNCIDRFNTLPKVLRSLTSLTLKTVNPNYIPILNKTNNFSTRYEKIRRILKTKNSIEILKYVSECFTSDERQSILSYSPKKLLTNFDIKVSDFNDNLNKMLAADYKTFLSDYILVKIDRATMSVSLEGREPFLDHRIIEFVAQLPSSFKYRNGNQKWLLKQITHKYLPIEMMNRPKKGFSAPLMEWFRSELTEYLMIYLDEKRLTRENLFNVKEVIRLKDSYLNGNKENVHKLWLLLMFEMWYEKWV